MIHPAMSSGLLLGSDPSLRFIGENRISGGATTLDFGSFTIPYDGLMIAVFTALGDVARTVSTVSLGGTNGTINSTFSASIAKRAIASRRVSAGSQNCTVTLSGGGGAPSSSGVGIYLLSGNKSDTPVGTGDSGLGATSSQEILSFDIGRGWSIYGGFVSHDPTTITWSSATSDSITLESTFGRYFAYASRRTITPATAYVETMSFTNGPDDALVVGASWE